MLVQEREQTKKEKRNTLNSAKTWNSSLNPNTTNKCLRYLQITPHQAKTDLRHFLPDSAAYSSTHILSISQFAVLPSHTFSK